MRSIPAAVFGPVLSPPWSLQRPFAIAGHWQSVPRRVFAPHRAALVKSPGEFPFFNHPRRFSWGVLLIFRRPPAPWPPGLHASGNYGLPAVRYPNVLNHYRLFAACSNLLKCEKSCLVMHPSCAPPRW